MVLSAVRAATTATTGAVGFLTRLPIGRTDTAWEAFTTWPAALVIVAYPLGALVALAVLAPLPAATVGIVLPAWIVVLTGINHLDGVADCGDAAAVHGTSDERHAALKDTDVGVGAAAAVGLVLVGLALAGIALADAPVLVAAGIVIAAEVGAKVGMAAVACLGTATHKGLGSSLTGQSTARDLGLPVAFAAPAVALTWPSPAAGGALLGALVAAAGVMGWARYALGGVSGDVFGAVNELARVVGLHAGVIAWTVL